MALMAPLEHGKQTVTQSQTHRHRISQQSNCKSCQYESKSIIRRTYDLQTKAHIFITIISCLNNVSTYTQYRLLAWPLLDAIMCRAQCCPWAPYTVYRVLKAFPFLSCRVFGRSARFSISAADLHRMHYRGACDAVH